MAQNHVVNLSLEVVLKCVVELVYDTLWLTQINLLDVDSSLSVVLGHICDPLIQVVLVSDKEHESVNACFE